ncbi:MAG TPA: GatB/YqeY domain-containing protein [Candidatus Binatia bacterium]|jgi:hypothetical protein|nr:GatB/YqeY domain-containing protein [Candidatus Binatia bacterium]
MALKQQIEQDLKTALLGGDKHKVITLRGLKSVILYAEVEKNKREAGLSDDEIMQLLAKESKKRQESADLYRQGHEDLRAETELSEKALIDAYLPKPLSNDELKVIIDEIIKTNGFQGTQAMGQVIGQVKQKVGASGDGATIAALTKEILSTT